jgi:hypothetical protein
MRTVMVNRRPIRQLASNKRSAGISVLDILNRKKHSRVALVLLSGLLDDPVSEVDSSDDDNAISSSSDEDDDIVDDLSLEDGLGLVYLSKVVMADQPIPTTIRIIQKKVVTIASYSDDECWNRIYIYMYTYICIYIHIYMYIYMYIYFVSVKQICTSL